MTTDPSEDYRTIWKFPLDFGVTRIVGGYPKIVHVDADPAGQPDDMPTVWVELHPEGDDTLNVTFVGTGHPAPQPRILWEHVGSVVMRSSGLVWHVYAWRA